jgi:hypothetical protein
MSIFGQRFSFASSLLEAEFADSFDYEPRIGSVNGDSAVDPTRQAGSVRVVLKKPGMILGTGISLGSAHVRASSDIFIKFRAIGLLANVQQFDRFFFTGLFSNPSRPLRFEVADGPRPVGFDWWEARVLELVLDQTDPAPVADGTDPLRNSEPVKPWN